MQGKRTIIFGIIVAVLGALQGVQAVDWIALLGEQAAGLVLSGIGIGIMVLRALTSTPLLSKS